MTVDPPEATATLEQHRQKAAADAEAWNEEWSRFPTVSQDGEGNKRYWAVPEDSGVFQGDWAKGEDLARQTVAQMQRFHAGSSVLRLILREIDFESTIGQGFITRIEDMLTRPELYLDSLEPGAVRAKLKAHAEAEKSKAG